MKKCLLYYCLFFSFFSGYSQSNEIKFEYDFVQNEELQTFLNFEGIQYFKLKFSGDSLANKTYKLSVKEFWDGDLKSDSLLTDSNRMPYDQLKTVNDTVFEMTVISKYMDQKLKMNFKYPVFGTSRTFEATKPENEFAGYSLRILPHSFKTKIEYGKKFYLLGYILPYKNGDYLQYCAVEQSGKDIENWGKEFGIKHYLVFEMLFE